MHAHEMRYGGPSGCRQSPTSGWPTGPPCTVHGRASRWKAPFPKVPWRLVFKIVGGIIITVRLKTCRRVEIAVERWLTLLQASPSEAEGGSARGLGVRAPLGQAL